MRVVGLALAGVLALTAPIAAKAGDGSGSGWHHPATGSWQFGAGRVASSNGGWCPPHWAPNEFRGKGPYRGPAVPTYWVWGPSGGAFDYPDLLGQSP